METPLQEPNPETGSSTETDCTFLMLKTEQPESSPASQLSNHTEPTAPSVPLKGMSSVCDGGTHSPSPKCNKQDPEHQSDRKSTRLNSSH